jgi:hypothetical protein
MASAADVAAQMVAALAVSEPELDTSVGTPVRKILDVVAESVAAAYVDQHLLNYQLDIDSKRGADLDDFVAVFGFTRFAAQRGTGVVTFARPTPADQDYPIAAGTQVTTATSVPAVFATVSPAILQRGVSSVDVPVQAIVGGQSGNLAANTLVRLASPASGVASVTNSSPTTGGTSSEDDLALIDRFKRTVFRSLAGTEDMFLGLSLEDSTPDTTDDGVATRARVIGSSSHWREQVQIDGSGDATSSIPATSATYIYADNPALGADLDAGQILTLGVHYCVDKNTQALSHSGWVDHRQIQIGDEILSLNLDRGVAEWTPVTDLYRAEVDEPLVSMEGRSISALVTTNHRWPVTNAHRIRTSQPAILRETHDLRPSDGIVVTAPLEESIESIYTDDFVRLLGWVASDGSFDSQPRKLRVKIGQSHLANPEKVEEIRLLLKRLGHPYQTYIDDDITIFAFSRELARQVRSALPDKKLTYELISVLPVHQREMLIDTLIKGDGGMQGGGVRGAGTGTRYFCTASADQADVFQALCALVGLPTRQGRKVLDTPFGRVQMHHVNIKKVRHVSVAPMKKSLRHYAGPIWCPTTRNGTFLARRGGRTYFTGNSFDATVIPPEVHTIGVGLTDGAIYDLDFEYNSSASRNDPAAGITNRVDVWVDGDRPVDASETTYMRTARVFTSGSTDALFTGKFVRQGTVSTHPTAANIFMQLAFGPIDVFPSPLIIGGNTYVKGTDYWVVHDDTAYGYSPRSLFGLEWLAAHHPANNAAASLQYSYNAIPRDVQERVERWRLVATDVRAHAAKRVLLRLNFAIMFVPGYDPAQVATALQASLAVFLAAKDFGSPVQVSDVIQVAHEVTGVDNIRLLTSAEPTTGGAYAIERVDAAGTRISFITAGSSPARAADVQLGDNEVPALYSINYVAKAANSFGVS